MTPKFNLIALVQLTRFLLSLTGLLLLAESALAYPLTQEQQDRLEQYLPATFARLQRKAPVHFAVVGDGVSRMITYDDERENLLHSLHGNLFRGIEGEFYYTGGIRMVNPIGERPEKLNEHIGPEILFEEFTQAGATTHHALQMLTTRALMNQPQAVFIQLGLNDALKGINIDTTKANLQSAIDLCRAQNCEVVLCGPTLVRLSQKASSWGITRQYTSAVRDVAEANNVMFLDPGLALLDAIGGESSAGTPNDRARRVSDLLGLALFDYGPDRQENIFMTAKAHEMAGRGMFHQFLNGTESSTWAMEASANLIDPDTVSISVNLTNSSDSPRGGHISALDFGLDLEPAVGESVREFKLEAGASTTFEMTWKRRILRSNEDGTEYFPLAWNGDTWPISFFVSDGDATELIETDVSVSPVGVRWKIVSQEDQSASFPLEFTIVNTSAEQANGTYELTYSNQRAEGTFDLEPGASRGFAAQCRLPRDANVERARDAVSLRIRTGDSEFIFDREVEATRESWLGKSIPLSTVSSYEPGTPPIPNERQNVSMTATADTDFLTLHFEANGLVVQQAQGQASVELAVTLDGRPVDEVRKPGFVAPLVFEFSGTGGEGKLREIVPAAFGNHYNKLLQPAGVTAAMTSGENDQLKFVVHIPRVYIYRHEWALDTMSSEIGLRAQMRFLRLNRDTGDFSFPPEATWVTNGPRLHPNDAIGLTTLKLNTSAPDVWTVRLY